MSEDSSSKEEVDLAAIEARLTAATPGPWEWHYGNDYNNTDHLVSMAEGLGTKDPIICHFGNNSYVERRSGIAPDDDDEDLIAHAPTDIAALLARARQQDARIAELEAEKDKAFTAGAKETKERALIVINMAGLMETSFGERYKARVITEIYQLVQAMPIELEPDDNLEYTNQEWDDNDPFK
jgi:hypothetical protein